MLDLVDWLTLIAYGGFYVATVLFPDARRRARERENDRLRWN